MLKQALESIKDKYDYILIDCAPSLGLLTLNALTAADSVIIPIQCEYFALEGLGKLLNTIKSVQKIHNSNLDIEGLLLTMFDSRLRLSNQVVEEVQKHFHDMVFETIIQRNVKLSEAPSYGESIILIDKQKCERYNRSQLNIKKINSKINNANWFHMMYINELIEYNDDLLSKTKSMVISGDICGGVDKKKFNIELLKYFDFLFLSIDDLHNEISINDIRKHIKGYIIIHNSHHCEIVGNENSQIKINVELDKTHILTDVNVLGAGDYFAASFIYFMLNKDIHDMEFIKEAIIFSHKEVSNKLKFN
jgi:hypothetical protein